MFGRHSHIQSASPASQNASGSPKPKLSQSGDHHIRQCVVRCRRCQDLSSAAAMDARIRYFRQEENIGPTANFEFVYRQATGEYFMWAADDDRRSSTYIEKLIAALQERPAAVLCAMEACYETPDKVVQFFPQYSEIYSGLGGTKKDRILKMMAHLGTANII